LTDLAVAGCRPAGAGELTVVLPSSVGAGEGGPVVSSDAAGVSAGRRGAFTVAASLACFRSFFFLRKHEPKDGMCGFRCFFFFFFLCSSVAPKPLWFGMVYTKKEGSSSWVC
jgi:hypothetical protein